MSDAVRGMLNVDNSRFENTVYLEKSCTKQFILLESEGQSFGEYERLRRYDAAVQTDILCHY